MSLKHEKHIRTEKAAKSYLTKGWGYVAAFALLPYAILKSLWAWGSTVGLTTKQAAQDVAAFGDTLKEGPAYTIGIDFTAVLAILASLFALVFVTSWGEKLPKWLLIIPGWSIGVLTVLICFMTTLQFFGVLPKGYTEGLAIWVYVVTYGGLFVWGATVFIATLSFQHRIKNKQSLQKGTYTL
ncbi:hypothetical protein JOC94_001276 [Bacillus thermophilus]|uniref:Uncharacterized protein n=1 Tax=Siminovitchia thermophila TaxID=1245522 RepID=A0ABS2R552_9BACI|nr:hypothetical protein [Siminovitchia thermophila]MBM7714304.1 hypothetical protein [Siminovitchia thermophila]ONK22205.1 hypothetical protein BLX87_17430 [Bacillus sp. VT-16-64]